jgi:hypothetical protein
MKSPTQCKKKRTTPSSCSDRWGFSSRISAACLADLGLFGRLFAPAITAAATRGGRTSIQSPQWKQGGSHWLGRRFVPRAAAEGMGFRFPILRRGWRRRRRRRVAGWGCCRNCTLQGSSLEDGRAGGTRVRGIGLERQAAEVAAAERGGGADGEGRREGRKGQGRRRSATWAVGRWRQGSGPKCDFDLLGLVVVSPKGKVLSRPRLSLKSAYRVPRMQNRVHDIPCLSNLFAFDP